MTPYPPFQWGGATGFDEGYRQTILTQARGGPRRAGSASRRLDKAEAAAGATLSPRVALAAAGVSQPVRMGPGLALIFSQFLIALKSWVGRRLTSVRGNERLLSRSAGLEWVAESFPHTGPRGARPLHSPGGGGAHGRAGGVPLLGAARRGSHRLARCLVALNLGLGPSPETWRAAIRMPSTRGRGAPTKRSVVRRREPGRQAGPGQTWGSRRARWSHRMLPGKWEELSHAHTGTHTHTHARAHSHTHAHTHARARWREVAKHGALGEGCWAGCQGQRIPEDRLWGLWSF